MQGESVWTCESQRYDWRWGGGASLRLVQSYWDEVMLHITCYCLWTCTRVPETAGVLTSRTSSALWAAGHRKMNLHHRGPPQGPGPDSPSSEQKKRLCCVHRPAAGSPQSPSPDRGHETASASGHLVQQALIYSETYLSPSTAPTSVFSKCS